MSKTPATDFLPPDPALKQRVKISLDRTLIELGQDLIEKEDIYNARIAAGRMTAADAEKRLAALRNARDTLRHVEEHAGFYRRCQQNRRAVDLFLRALDTQRDELVRMLGTMLDLPENET